MESARNRFAIGNDMDLNSAGGKAGLIWWGSELL